jgi:hypothetical protein
MYPFIFFYMNTTAKEVIYNMKNLKQGGKQSQDALLSDAQYLFIIDYYRNLLVNRDYMRKKQIASSLEQTIKAKLERVKSMEEDMFNERKVYKVLGVPSVIETDVRPLYSGVRRSMLESSIDRSDSKSIRHDLNSPLTGMNPRYFPLDSSLYVVTPEPMQELFVSAVFENPIKVVEAKGELNPFDPYNFEYPFPQRMLDTLYKMMRNGEINMAMVVPNDVDSDGRETPATSAPRQARVEDES